MAGARHPWLGPAVVVGALAPLALVGIDAVLGRLPADPIASVLNQLGLLALVLLVASLACTPLRLVTRWSWTVAMRRTLGLLGFTYATIHALFYIAVDQGFSWRVLVKDVLERPFIAVGMLAWLALIPLALTSRPDSIKKLGAKRWRRLHKLAYVAAGLGVVHFLLRVKADLTQPLLYGAVLAGLFAVRGWDWWRGRQKTRVLPTRS